MWMFRHSKKLYPALAVLLIFVSPFVLMLLIPYPPLQDPVFPVDMIKCVFYFANKLLWARKHIVSIWLSRANVQSLGVLKLITLRGYTTSLVSTHSNPNDKTEFALLQWPVHTHTNFGQITSSKPRQDKRQMHGALGRPSCTNWESEVGNERPIKEATT